LLLKLGELVRDFAAIPALVTVFEPEQLLCHAGFRHFPVNVTVIRCFEAGFAFADGKELRRQFTVAHRFRCRPVQPLRRRAL